MKPEEIECSPSVGYNATIAHHPTNSCGHAMVKGPHQ